MNRSRILQRHQVGEIDVYVIASGYQILLALTRTFRSASIVRLTIPSVLASHDMRKDLNFQRFNCIFGFNARHPWRPLATISALFQPVITLIERAVRSIWPATEIIQ